MSVCVLGVDAAWTERNGSGVALIENVAGRWVCRGVAPTYAEFYALRDGARVDWSGPTASGGCDLDQLVRTVGALALSELVLVAVDMPIATVAITGRRKADNDVSLAFGARGCGTHTPSASRPGPVGVALTQGLAWLGFTIATISAQPSLIKRQVIEVYQHPALLALLGRAYRVPYKLAKRDDYWKDESPSARISLLLKEWRVIEAALRSRIDHIDLDLPTAESRPSTLKRYEDALDALVAAWIGAEFLAGRTTAYGDDTAAIWVPNEPPD